jgi:prepilin-type N-terminal cleavage/methylation domain-containing protein
MEWFGMALILSKMKKAPRRGQAGMSLVELMIAMMVFVVGVTGTMVLMIIAVGTNGRNRQQSNATAIAQMVTEKISSVPASASPNLIITDCTNANNTVSTAAGGPTLLASGAIDFSAAVPANYSMSYTACGTNGRQMAYDVRWNIQTISPYVKLVTVSAKMRGAGTDLKYFSPAVTIRTQVGA